MARSSTSSWTCVPDSPTYKRWERFELTAQNGSAIYVPEGFAHGFQTLADDTEVLYQMSEFYSASSRRWRAMERSGLRHRLAAAEPILSPKDAAYPDFDG